MGNKFQLESQFSPSGDQPSAIKALVDGINAGEKFQTLLGVTGSGKTFTLANVIKQTKRPSLIMAPNKTLAAQLYAEMKEFFPNNSVEYFVSYYDYYQPEAYVPASDTFIEKDSSINEQIEQMRLSATKSLLERDDVIIIASVSAIYGLGDPESYMSMLLHLSVGEVSNQNLHFHDHYHFLKFLLSWYPNLLFSFQYYIYRVYHARVYLKVSFKDDKGIYQRLKYKHKLARKDHLSIVF